MFDDMEGKYLRFVDFWRQLFRLPPSDNYIEYIRRTLANSIHTDHLAPQYLARLDDLTTTEESDEVYAQWFADMGEAERQRYRKWLEDRRPTPYVVWLEHEQKVARWEPRPPGATPKYRKTPVFKRVDDKSP